jgi:hypothetical protein
MSAVRLLCEPEDDISDFKRKKTRASHLFSSFLFVADGHEKFLHAAHHPYASGTFANN